MSHAVKLAPAHSAPKGVIPRVWASTALYPQSDMTQSEDHGDFCPFPWPEYALGIWALDSSVLTYPNAYKEDSEFAKAK